jgi:hypothetical protein
MSKILQLLGFASLLAVASCEQATAPSARQPVLPATQNVREFGDYALHFNAVTTNQLTPAIARQYDIVRSNSRAMLNVSINRKEPGTLGRSVPGRITVSAVNLTGQQKNLMVREIRESDAVYYISEVGIANEETLIFTIDVARDDVPEPLSVRYQRKFYVD